MLTRVSDKEPEPEVEPRDLTSQRGAPHDARPFMPKVTFVNEDRTVEVERGRLISDIATELGIATCREEFAGTGIGDYTVWVKGDDGALRRPASGRSSAARAG